jgi:hypothetical protein
MAKATTRALATTTVTTPDVQPVLGVVLQIGSNPGTQVPINASSLANFKTQGVDMGLTNPIDLGTIDSIIDWINTEFQSVGMQIQLPTKATIATYGLPDPLTSVFTAIFGYDVSIQKAHVKIPASTATDQNKYYTLVMSVTASVDTAVKVGPIALVGATIGVTNEPPAAS